MATVSSRPARQLAMVFDLNKCLGCQSCSIACKTLWTDAPGMESMWWNIVNTMPGGGTPRDVFSHGGGYKNGEPVPGTFPPLREFGEAWGFDQEATFASGGKAAFRPLERDGSSPEWGPNWDEDMGGGQYPNSYFFYLQQICANCSKPACLEACPRTGLYRREEDGIILIDEER
ncbi:MAG: respiratory nitrate reductase subunit beta, partial [Bryobacteraceae bacterium]|nr:respiratory nitrate reductase subunit beta [Bryobacteraceae bacterium]